ncbi:MAG: DUF2147 domain-containing protein [Winogradskyella sp.]|uniref:DUF2147 domain-containing protein n=1 Tax=Winogradskyella sp. TaxID=1883156 RepID=UPI000F3BDE92|nr:DUF2147 domain-containing protein [Winogradskyella sp.]RNC87086.1 MAG: DUF2147 domain-containing protein [Winogradskyella sp.]
MKKIAVYLVLSAFVSVLFPQTKADKIIGEYWTETKEGKIEIFKKDNKYFGKIMWRKDARLDTENPDENLRDRSVIGVVFMKDFVFKKDKWVGGEVYSIENGGTYSGKMWLENNDDTLKMRGYLGLSLFGKTATFTRVE